MRHKRIAIYWHAKKWVISKFTSYRILRSKIAVAVVHKHPFYRKRILNRFTDSASPINSTAFHFAFIFTAHQIIYGAALSPTRRRQPKRRRREMHIGGDRFRKYFRNEKFYFCYADRDTHKSPAQCRFVFSLLSFSTISLDSIWILFYNTTCEWWKLKLYALIFGIVFFSAGVGSSVKCITIKLRASLEWISDETKNRRE